MDEAARCSSKIAYQRRGPKSDANAPPISARVPVRLERDRLRRSGPGGCPVGKGFGGGGLNLLVAVTLILLVVSLRNSWGLLVSVGAATLDGRPEEPD